ncbi:Mandelate racemase/muconate lactonizing enzyme [Rhodopseudomonas palustris HaA2]|uniref:Mandelate racemase/muconate lactonizing enzyme n=1 Tax=Rhodopseudomonas palustris (strain HaA2) TaxID=316058 RepID=Q2ISQ6_RHOP2|nr:mandelate racemase/muconate lactonizing enzyme family protein [Rhodopseudomonas palustris]ABD08754.1 Mandelate racemase/muconate lactonizing enzyme [Rhodopseudomonas palustris HaA2]
MTAQDFTIRSIEAMCFRYPLSLPVVTSFGRMTTRPAVFIRVTDEDGISGWGEAWANFPATGAEHRARTINEVLAPLAAGARIAHPSEFFEALTQRTAVLALQSGEQGPFAQAIAGIDLALWDLFARRRATPLWRLLGGANATIKVYASGINPTGTREMAETALARGHRALKLKIGFGAEIDHPNLAALRALAGDGTLAADANQAWTLQQACEAAPHLRDYNLAWLEEPIRADRPWPEWQALRRAATMPLAAGENFASRESFQQALSDDTLGVIQPDIAKWGGLSACAPIARDIVAAGKRFCPHYLGGGIGLLASAHLLAGIGGDGLLEVDANDNPLREAFCGPVAAISDGAITLGDAPGLGVEPDLVGIAQYRTV